MNDSLSVSAQLHMEEVCARFEAAWQAARPDSPAPRIGDYLSGTTGPERRALLRELLRLDLHYRRRRGWWDCWPGRCIWRTAATSSTVISSRPTSC